MGNSQFRNIPGGGAEQFKQPVQSVGDLPSTGNSYGDVRVVLDSNEMYIWGQSDSWVLSSGGGGSGSTPFEQTFVTSDWILNSGEYKITINESTHSRGSDIIVQVQELVGSFYQPVDTNYSINATGDITIIIGNDSRFNGRVLIQGA
jgi:hypothetical protein